MVCQNSAKTEQPSRCVDYLLGRAEGRPSRAAVRSPDLSHSVPLDQNK